VDGTPRPGRKFETRRVPTVQFDLYDRFNHWHWLDEAMLALNLEQRSFFGLLDPLDYNLRVPLGFLFIERSCSTEKTIQRVPFVGQGTGTE